MTVNTDNSAASAIGVNPFPTRPSNAASLAAKPTVSGMAAIEPPAASAVQKSTGILWRRSESRRRSRVPASWSIVPTTMKRVALNRACEASTARPPYTSFGEPDPVKRKMKPSCDTVP